MDKKPSSINSKNTKKWTRRRVMQYAYASGFTATAAAALTPDDVKASGPNEVVIPVDTEGKYKKTVSAEWYDHFTKARKVTKEIKSKHFGKEGILSIGQGGGPKDPAHVVVELDETNSKKHERRGELPESKDGIRIEIKEGSPDNLGLTCTPQRKDSDEREYPGGLETELSGGIVREGGCTNSSRITNGSGQDFDRGWTVSAHCTSNCGTGDDAYHPTFPTATDFGDVVLADVVYDFAYIERDSDFTPLSKVVKPNDHSTSHHISGTVSESNMAWVRDNGVAVNIWGASSCEVWGYIDSLDWGICESDEFDCVDCKLGQFSIRNPNGNQVIGGDSGSLMWVRDPGSGDYFAAGATNGWKDDQLSWGVQGYTIRSDYNIWWA